MADLPAVAAWRHLDARLGFEVVFLGSESDGYRVEGHVAAVEDGVAWAVRYTIALDAAWTTRSARVSSRSARGTRNVLLEGDGSGEWRVDGSAAPQLAGCLDVDLEASAFTNAFPVRRLGLDIGEEADAPAAYVRAVDVEVERLHQHYARLPGEDGRSHYDYAAPAFDFRAELVYDSFGLVIDYPGIAVRVA